MAIATGPEYAVPPPSATKGARGDAKRKQNNGLGAGGDGGKGQKRKKKEVFIYGNYRNYYGYRFECDEMDPPELG